VVERTPFEDKQFVRVPLANEPLHLVGMHAVLAQKAKDGEFPESVVLDRGRVHIVHKNYIV
jgi:hypothetical protein